MVWLPEYYRQWKQLLPSDVLAALSVGIVAVPQSLAYAGIAQVSLYKGFVSAFIPPIMYSLFSSSYVMIVGPTSILSLLVSSASANDTEASFMALMMGLFSIAFAYLRLGSLFSTVASPMVISGFTSAAAILILTREVPKLIGVVMEKGQSNSTFTEIVKHMAQGSVPSSATMAFGLPAVAFLLLVRLAPDQQKYSKFVSGACVLATVIISMVAFHFSGATIEHIEPVSYAIEVGLPSVSVSRAGAIILTAALCALVGFVEAISISSTFESKQHMQIGTLKLDGKQELVGIGISNVVGAFMGSYCVTGSFSRTALNFGAGARSTVSNACAAIIVFIAVAACGPRFSSLPKTTLAAIVIAAVSQMISFSDPFRFGRLVRQQRSREALPPLLVWVSTFISILCVGVQEGIGIGIGVNVLFLVIAGKRLLELDCDSESRTIQVHGCLSYTNISKLKDAVAVLDGSDPITLDLRSVISVDAHVAEYLSPDHDDNSISQNLQMPRFVILYPSGTSLSEGVTHQLALFS